MYWKYTNAGYLVSFGEGNGKNQIDAVEYNRIVDAYKSRPVRDGYGYRLREDLTWEEYPVDPPDPDPEIDDAELLEILMGGAE